VFQSHNGAIAAPTSRALHEPSTTFQSHNGAIAAGKICGDGVLVIGRFQSHNGAIAASIVVGCDAHNRFQSHNGAIAAGQGEWEILLRPGFNPTMVRLLRFVGYAALMLPCLVSIPQWCDCCG